MEEEKYLYPAEGVSPVEVGVNYKDYYLNDILKRNDCNLEYVILLRKGANTAVALARICDKINNTAIRLCPREGGAINDKIIDTCGRIFGDAVIRYFNDSEEPYVVSLVSYDKSETIKLSDFE